MKSQRLPTFPLLRVNHSLILSWEEVYSPSKAAPLLSEAGLLVYSIS